MGSHDNHLYIYKIDPETHKYHLHCHDHRSSAWVNAIDWTVDSTYLRSSSGDHEVLYFDVSTKLPDVHGSQTVVDKVWASNTVKHSADREGLKPHDADKTHVKDVLGA